MIQIYYDDNLNTYKRQIGAMNKKIVIKRNIKKILKWYFQDKFGLTINLIGLIWMVI